MSTADEDLLRHHEEPRQPGCPGFGLGDRARRQARGHGRGRQLRQEPAAQPQVPYSYEGRAANYVPDFLIRLRDAASNGEGDLLTLVLEVSGEAKKEKQAKVAAAHDLWVPAVNAWGRLGRWGFLEVTHLENAAELIREKFIRGRVPA